MIDIESAVMIGLLLVVYGIVGELDYVEELNMEQSRWAYARMIGDK